MLQDPTLWDCFYTIEVSRKSIFEKTIQTPDGKEFASVPDIFVARLRTLQIIRLAPFEGVAFFGIVVCLLAGQTGAIQAQPIYWLAGVPTLIVVGLVLLAFPTKDRLAALFEECQMMKTTGSSALPQVRRS